MKIYQLILIIITCFALQPNIYAQTNKVIDSLKKAVQTANHDTTRLRLLNIMVEEESNDKIWPEYNQQMRTIAEKNLATHPSALIVKKVKKYLANSYNNIGYLSNNQGDVSNALDYYSKSIKIREELGDKLGLAESFNNIGVLYKNQSDVPKAIEYYNKSLKIYEDIHDLSGVATSLNNIGYIYNNKGDIPKSINYYNRSMKIQESIGDKQGLVYTLINIGGIYKALAFHKQNIHDLSGIDSLMAKALEYYDKSVSIENEIGDKKGLVYSLINIGSIYFAQNNIPKAKNFAEKAYSLSKELGFPDNIGKAAGMLKTICQKQGDYKKAFNYFNEEIIMLNKVANKENYKNTQKQQARYEYGKKAAADSVAHSKAMEISNLVIAKQKAESKRQKMVIGFTIFGLLLVLSFAVLIFRSLRITRRQKNIIETQRDEISAQRDTVTEQKEHIEEIYQEISDSINYAKRIQQAMLPDFTDLFGNLKISQFENKTTFSNLQINTSSNYFVLFKPKDVVSGDFYWATCIDKMLIITLADCTGHGVPGAFMSMLGISFLNEIVRKKEITKAAEVLDQLRTSVIEALKQKNKNEEHTSTDHPASAGQGLMVQDGMDIALCAINLETLEMQFAGANNPCWIITKFENLKINQFENGTASSNLQIDTFSNQLIEPTNELVELKGDKMPIGIHDRMNPFENHTHQLQKGDAIYLMSDGYEDQFGGPNRKKFLSKNLKNLIIANCQLTMTKQKELLETTINEWIGSGEQIDDITVMGIKISEK